MIELISAFFKELFIPDREKIGNMMDETESYISSKFPFLEYSDKIVNIFQGERFIEDVNVGLSLPYVGSFNFKIIESKYVNDGIQAFRAIIRGWIILMVMFYHINEFLSFIGQRESFMKSEKVNSYLHEKYDRKGN